MPAPGVRLGASGQLRAGHLPGDRHRRRFRRTRRERPRGAHRGQGEHRDQRVRERCRGDGGEFPPRRVVQNRGHGLDGRGRVPVRHRTEQRGDQQGRRDHLPGGGGGGAPVAPGRGGRRGHLHPARDAPGDCRRGGGAHAGDPGAGLATAVPARER